MFYFLDDNYAFINLIDEKGSLGNYNMCETLATCFSTTIYYGLLTGYFGFLIFRWWYRRNDQFFDF